MRIIGALGILLFVSGTSTQLQAYDADTHRAIARRSTQPDVSSLDAVLKTEFGMAGGIGEKVFKGTLQERALEQLIGEGAFSEDDPVLRVLNHFHNPLAATWGEAGLRLSGVPAGQSSVLWQQNRAQGSSSGGGNWSWSDARQHYQKALSSTSRVDRDLALADTFRTLGHLTHLIQDASVPAHARNDPHLSFALLGFKIPINPDWYEDWVEETRKDRVDIFNSLLNAPPIRPPGSIFTPTKNAEAPLPIARLIDTDKFLEASFVPLSDLDIGIAEYANGNYLSRDTIFTTFSLPRKGSLGPGFFEPVGQKFRRYFPKVAEGETISHFVTEGALFDSIEAAVGAPPIRWVVARQPSESRLRGETVASGSGLFGRAAGLLLPRET